jgi:flavodoxin I
MNTLVVYASKTGNTKKLTDHIAQWLRGDNTYVAVEDAPQPQGYDVIIVAFWLAGGKPEPKTAEYLQRIESARLFLVATHGAAAGSDHAQGALRFAAALPKSAELAGSFSCQGEVNPAVLAKIREKSPPPPWLADADSAVGHPDEKDLADLRQALRQGLPDRF